MDSVLTEEEEKELQQQEMAVQQPAEGSRRKTRDMTDGFEFVEELTVLLHLALAVCSADLPDIEAAIRSLVSSERGTLCGVSSRLCRELASCSGMGLAGDEGSGRQGSKVAASSSMSKYVSAFLKEQRNLGGRSQHTLNVPSNWHSETAASNALSQERRTPLDVPKRVATAPRLERGASDDSAVARRQTAQRGVSNESLASGKTSMTQLSAMMRSMLHGHADKGKGVTVGDVTWGMDGVPLQDSDDYIAQQARGLVQRYRQRSGAGTGAGGSEDLPTPAFNKGTLMAFVTRSSRHNSSMRERSPGESEATSALLDRVLFDAGKRGLCMTQETLTSMTSRQDLAKESRSQTATKESVLVADALLSCTSMSNCAIMDLLGHEGGRMDLESAALSDIACPSSMAEPCAMSSQGMSAAEACKEAEEAAGPGKSQRPWQADEQRGRRRRSKATPPPEFRRGLSSTLDRAISRSHLPPQQAVETGLLDPKGVAEPAKDAAGEPRLLMRFGIVEPTEGAAPVKAADGESPSEGQTAGTPRTDVTGEASTDAEKAAAWAKYGLRKERRASRMRQKVTYGQIVRCEHEQLISVGTSSSTGAASASTDIPSEEQACPAAASRSHSTCGSDRASSSVHWDRTSKRHSQASLQQSNCETLS